MNELIDKDYLNDLKTIKETIRQNQNKVMVIVNSALIMTYYEIGTIINKRKTWGSKYIQKLSEDLKEYGKGYSIQNLKFMCQFSDIMNRMENGLQVASQIPWFTIVRIIGKSKSNEEILWYINQTHKFGWSRSQVIKQFENKAYERNLIEPDTSPTIKSDNSVSELFKDSYVFDFLNKDNTRTEELAKNSLSDNVVSFIKELGPGFTLVDKEFKIVTPTNKAFYIDLLMYHIKLHVYIIIEIKNREFRPQDLGQLLFYVNAVDDLERVEGDNESVGLILCKDADRYTARTILSGINKKIGISKYKILEELPSYLERRLKE